MEMLQMILGGVVMVAGIALIASCLRMLAIPAILSGISRDLAEIKRLLEGRQ
jgi:hypothetical protein